MNLVQRDRKTGRFLKPEIPKWVEPAAPKWADLRGGFGLQPDGTIGANQDPLTSAGSGYLVQPRRRESIRRAEIDVIAVAEGLAGQAERALITGAIGTMPPPRDIALIDSVAALHKARRA